MTRLYNLTSNGRETVVFTPFQSMIGRWGNKTFRSNTSLHLDVDCKLPVATSGGKKLNKKSRLPAGDEGKREKV